MEQGQEEAHSRTLPSIYIYYTKLDPTSKKIFCPVESCVVLALIKYTCTSSAFNINFVKHETPGIPVEMNDVLSVADRENAAFLSADSLDVPVKYCQLPVYFDNQYYCVAGLCSILRQIIKTADCKFISLLGFRENCLSACAEQSNWTKFCEVDSMKCLYNFLRGNTGWMTHMQHLELRLKEPLKIHNKVNSKIHVHDGNRYCDSTEFSLSDFILIVCVHILHVNSKNMWLHQLPQVKKWYDLIMSNQSISKLLTMFSPIDQVINDVTIDFSNLTLNTSKPDSKYQKARKFTARSKDAVNFVNDIQPKVKQHMTGYGNDIDLDITSIPYCALPESGDLPQDRVERKWHQLASMTRAVMKICSPNDVIVDFCSGGGHLGLLIAYLVPQCRVVLLDNKTQSLSRAQDRATKLKLSNLSIIQSNVDYFTGRFQIGICLHACGVASDLVMQLCVHQNASMVVSPCCYGKIQTCHTVSYPRSQWLQELGITSEDHHLMSHCADRDAPDWMDWIDADRLEWTRENGYNVYLGKLTPLNCTPKNNLLVASKVKALESS